MAEVTTSFSLKDLAGKLKAEQAAAAQNAPVRTPDGEPKVRVKKIDNLGRAYATGRRKDAVARVWLKPGTGKVMVNGREGQSYFGRPVLWMLLNQPFGVVQSEGRFDVMCTISGGGLSGQAGALRHGISRALVHFDPELHKMLKPHGFLTRDSRKVERKKYGKAKARRSFQFSKR